MEVFFIIAGIVIVLNLVYIGIYNSLAAKKKNIYEYAKNQLRIGMTRNDVYTVFTGLSPKKDRKTLLVYVYKQKFLNSDKGHRLELYFNGYTGLLENVKEYDTKTTYSTW